MRPYTRRWIFPSGDSDMAVDPIITRVWAMPHKWTFKVKPLLDVITRYMKTNSLWLDPFAGQHSPVPYDGTNDLNPDNPSAFHMEATDFLRYVLDEMGAESVDGIVFDPPYSLTQVSKSYADIGLKFKGAENPTGGFPKARDTIAELVRDGGHVISYGWNTVGMGKKRGFVPVEYIICSHGGNRNDTLVTVEQRQRCS